MDDRYMYLLSIKHFNRIKNSYDTIHLNNNLITRVVQLLNNDLIVKQFNTSMSKNLL